MAPRSTVISFAPIVALSTLVALVLQLHGVLLLWKMHQTRQIDAIRIGLLRKKSYFFRNVKQLKQRDLYRKKRSCWHKPGRTDLWWKNIWTGVAPEECWKENFRMSRAAFVNLVSELRPYISPNPKSPNHRALSAEKKVAVALYFLKDTGSLRMTANSFGIALNTASAVVNEVCQAISNYLGPKYLHLPEDEESMREKVAEFEAKFGMTQAFGCIDGTHIPIQCPSENSQDFFFYKQFFSLSVQAVCDYKGSFMDVECKWPGSVHDAKVFANSSISAKLRSNKLPCTFQTPIPGGVKIPNYLIGDPAYPLLPFCMKEYDSCTSNEQVVFNNMLRSARNQIECAFGRLKARWSILTTKVGFKLEAIPTIIYACFVLHNYCEKHNMYVDQDLVDSQIQLMKENEDQFKNTPDPIYSCDVGEGSVVRTTLTQLVLKNL
nr:putative nuclease HARBI1 [Pocillopora verrucosa]